MKFPCPWGERERQSRAGSILPCLESGEAEAATEERRGRERRSMESNGMGPAPAAAMRDDEPSSLSASSPTSPPSKTPPLSPPPPPLSPLPPPPPLSTHPLFRSSLPPHLTPPGYGPPQGPKGGSFVEHLVGVGDSGARTDEDLAGVPAELLPLKKRIVRYHPYAAAWAIQEMASLHGGLGGDWLRRRPREEEEEKEDGLRAELLRLRITRPSLLLTKPLTLSDRNPDAARLVLPDKLVRASPLLGMLTAAERRLAFGRSGLPVPAFDRRGRAYRMTLRRDHSAGTFLLRGQWTVYLSRHRMCRGDAVELLAFRPSAWQARLHKHGEAGLGMAVLHCPCWTNRERDAADGLLLLLLSSPPGAVTASAAAVEMDWSTTPLVCCK